MSSSMARVLRKAAEELEVNGWIQCELFRGNASCAIGAIYRALGVTDRGDGGTVGLTAEVTTAVTIVKDVVSRHLGVLDLSTWNDDPRRTEQDVTKAFLEAADVEDFR